MGILLECKPVAVQLTIVLPGFELFKNFPRGKKKNFPFNKPQFLWVMYIKERRRQQIVSVPMRRGSKHMLSGLCVYVCKPACDQTMKITRKEKNPPRTSLLTTQVC